MVTRVNAKKEKIFLFPRMIPFFKLLMCSLILAQRESFGTHFSGMKAKPQTNCNLERPINILFSAVDLPSVYGANEERTEAFRERRNGSVNTSSGNMLPRNKRESFDTPSPSANFFVAGGHGSNNQPVFIRFHAILILEHNVLANELGAIYSIWDNERLYQTAEKIHIDHF